MKKILLTLTCLLIALPAFSLPERADKIIISSLTNIEKLLTEISNSEANSNFNQATFNSIQINRVPANISLRNFCNEFSRSASFLELIVNPTTNAIAYYFSTGESAADLKLCSH